MSNASNNFDTSALRLSPIKDMVMIQSGLYSDIQRYRIKCYTITNRKNRYGESDKAIGTSFFGSVGVFKELPRPDEISDYSLYQDVGYYLNENKQIVKEEIYNKEMKPSFDLSSFGGLKF